MGMDRWAQQASGFPSAGYEKTVLYPWAAILNNVEPDGTYTWGTEFQDFGGASSSFNVFDLVYAASSNVSGSPYENVTAYNPDSLISDILEALEDLRSEIQEYDTDTLNAAVDQAAEQVETLMGEDNIPDLVAAFSTRQNTGFNRDVSALFAGLWEGGAIIGTQAISAAALLRNDRNRALTEYELQLQVNRQGMRTQLVSQLLSTAVNIAFQKMQVRQALVGNEIDVMRYVVSAKQDQQDKDLEYITKDLTYDLDLMQYAQNALGSIYGAQQVPRQQTKGERLLAAVSGSISTGINAGLALGSPAAGIGLGAVNLATQLLLTPR